MAQEQSRGLELQALAAASSSDSPGSECDVSSDTLSPPSPSFQETEAVSVSYYFNCEGLTRVKYPFYP